MSSEILKIIFLGSLVMFLSSCSDNHEHEHTTPEKTSSEPAITNRINLSAEIISNLGITFEKVRVGKLGSWISVPGRLEVPREKQYFVNAPAPGRIFWNVERLTYVKKGDLLATIAGPTLSKVQQELAASKQALVIARERQGSDRGTKLRLEQAERMYRESLGRMVVLTGRTPKELSVPDDKGRAHWASLSKLELFAPGEGFLLEIHASEGELLEEGKNIGLILDINELIFRGRVAANLYPEIPKNAAVRIVVANNKVAESRLLGPFPVGDMATAKVWIEAKVLNEDKQLVHGLPTIANIQIKESGFAEAIIPEECLIFDDLQAILFKRDAAQPDFVIRTPVEIGNRSGRQIEVFSGVIAGDEIVCEGIHQIKILGAGKAPEGGHFHADGSWHDGEA